MFNLSKHEATFSHLNLRKEKHGEEDVAAADLSFQFQASNTILNPIDPALVPAFFRKPALGEQQSLPMEGTPLTALNLPLLGEQKIDAKYTGYEVLISSLLDYVDPLVYVDAKIKSITWKPIEGGSVAMSLKVSVLIDEDDDALLMAAWRRGGCVLTLTPPAAKTSTGDNLGDAIVDGDSTDGADADDEEIARQEAQSLIQAGQAADQAIAA
jgi:hypothetical protein